MKRFPWIVTALVMALSGVGATAQNSRPYKEKVLCQNSFGLMDVGVLGQVVEKVTGTTLDEFFALRVFVSWC